MTDPASPLLDFYPQDFVVDANGKKNAWECVVCIPFIKEDVLVDTVSGIDHLNELTPLERLRNNLGMMHRYPPVYGANETTDAQRDAYRRLGVDLKDNKAWGNALSRDNANKRAPPANDGFLSPSSPSSPSARSRF